MRFFSRRNVQAPSMRFSSTVISGKTFRRWGIYVNPKVGILNGSAPVMFRSCHRISPEFGTRNP